MSEKYKYGEKSFPNGYNPIVLLFCYRPISKRIASLIKNIKFISPNKITILGLIIFIISTLLISFSKDNYKHIKVKHPLESIVNDSINKILSFNSYPRGGNAYTPGSTGSNLSQSSGATFRVIIDTKDWDNSLASNAPGQSGNPNSKFYRNLYRDWANDRYFKLLYSKKEILKDLYEREIFYPN